MGNAWFGKKSSSKEGLVHPVDDQRHHDQGVTLKVRMTRGQLKELIAKVDRSKGHSELGHLIFQECLKGRLRPRLVAADKGSESTSNSATKWGLSPIQENSDDDHF